MLRALTRPEGAPSRLIPALLFGLGPLGAAIALDNRQIVYTERGPDVLIVQPGIEQEIKAGRRDAFVDLYLPQVDRTKKALLDLDPGDESRQVLDARHPDLILWGETFLPGKLFPPAAREAFDAGARPSAMARSTELTRREAEFNHNPVSYTHLTLPTIYSV